MARSSSRRGLWPEWLRGGGGSGFGSGASDWRGWALAYWFFSTASGLPCRSGFANGYGFRVRGGRRSLGRSGVKRSGCRGRGGRATPLDLELSSRGCCSRGQVGIDEAGETLGHDRRGLLLVLDGRGLGPLTVSLVAMSCCPAGEKRGWVEVMTRTSSRRSRWAAGLTMTSMKASRSGSRTTFSTVPTGSPRGKTWSPPAVRTFSPGLMR